MSRLTPPRIPEERPPSLDDRKPRVTWESILGKPTTLEGLRVTGTGSGPSTGPLYLQSITVPPLTLERLESAPGDLGLIEIMRDGAVLGYLAIDANDNIALIAPDGTTVYARFSKALPFSGDIDAAIGDNQVIEFRRQTIARAGIGLDGADELAIFDADGVTVLFYISGGDTWRGDKMRADTSVQTPLVLDGAGTQILQNQLPAVADAAVTAVAPAQTSAGGIAHAAGATPTAAEFDALVDDHNAAVADIGNIISTIVDVVTDLADIAGQLNTYLARGRTHGYIDT